MFMPSQGVTFFCIKPQGDGPGCERNQERESQADATIHKCHFCQCFMPPSPGSFWIRAFPKLAVPDGR